MNSAFCISIVSRRICSDIKKMLRLSTKQLNEESNKLELFVCKHLFDDKQHTSYKHQNISLHFSHRACFGLLVHWHSLHTSFYFSSWKFNRRSSDNRFVFTWWQLRWINSKHTEIILRLARLVAIAFLTAKSSNTFKSLWGHKQRSGRRGLLLM